MKDIEKKIERVLRIGIAGEFFGHAMFAVQGKAAWIPWVQKFLPLSNAGAIQFLFWIGVLDIIIALVVLVKPFRPVVLWAVFWGFWTALLRPIVGESFWDFIERWTNWAAPLALYFVLRSKDQPKV